jgi:type II secretory pathway pseudopilin PulG
MNTQIVLTVIEIVISLVIEGIILSMVFAYISNQTSEKQNKALKNEMSNIEIQNKFIYDQLNQKIETAKTEIISQIKESEAKK